MEDSPPGIDPQKVVLGSALLNLGSSLQYAIYALAEHHGRQVGPWLDQLEQRCIDGAKGVVSEGVSMDLEVKAYEGGIASVRQFFDSARTAIANGSAFT